MRKLYFDMLIDGQPVLVPDSDVAVSYEDLDSDESGRDESGYMHRIVLRHNVRKIPVAYAALTADEYLYMETLFKGKSQFLVDLREADGSRASFVAYRSKHGISIHNVRTGEYKNYNFNIIEC